MGRGLWTPGWHSQRKKLFLDSNFKRRRRLLQNTHSGQVVVNAPSPIPLQTPYPPNRNCGKSAGLRGTSVGSHTGDEAAALPPSSVISPSIQNRLAIDTPTSLQRSVTLCHVFGGVNGWGGAIVTESREFVYGGSRSLNVSPKDMFLCNTNFLTAVKSVEEDNTTMLSSTLL